MKWKSKKALREELRQTKTDLQRTKLLLIFAQKWDQEDRNLIRESLEKHLPGGAQLAFELVGHRPQLRLGVWNTISIRVYAFRHGPITFPEEEFKDTAQMKLLSSMHFPPVKSPPPNNII